MTSSRTLANERGGVGVGGRDKGWWFWSQIHPRTAETNYASPNDNDDDNEYNDNDEDDDNEYNDSNDDSKYNDNTELRINVVFSSGGEVPQF